MSAAPLADAAAGRTRLVLIGASGRMGRQILQLLPAQPTLQLTGAVVSERSAALGNDSGEQAGVQANGVPLTAHLAPLLAHTDVVVDFSTSQAVAASLADCARAQIPLLIGTTGLAPGLNAALGSAARRIPLLLAANTSLGVNLLLELVARAARALPRSYDIEVLEAHHRHKVDAPSGTALALASAAAHERGDSLEQRACYVRQGHTDERPSGQIGFAVIRGGDVIGEHQVLFLGEGETLTLSHRATDRAVFARGALAAAAWVAAQPPGRYTMGDYLASESDG